MNNGTDPASATLTLPPRTLAEAEAVIRHLKSPVPPRDMLAVIGATEGERFKEALEKAVGGSDADGRYVRGITQAVSEANRDRLLQLGIIVPPPEILVRLGVAHGEDFSRGVYAALNHTDEARRSEARKTVSGYIARAMADAGLPSAPPPMASNAGRASSRPPPAAEGSARHDSDDSPVGLTSMHDDPGTGGDPSDGTAGRSGDQKDRWLSTHVYGGKAALCFQADQLKDNVTRTVRLEACASLGLKNYDWKKKVAIQLSTKELPLLAGVFLGTPLKKFEVSGHNGKGFSVEDQGTHLFMSVNAKDQGSKAVRIPAGDTYPIITLLLRQLHLNDPHLPMDVIIRSINRVCTIAAATPAKPSGGQAAQG